MSAYEIKHPGLNLGSADELTHKRAETGVFGFWVFLMSDAVIFALLFATYGVMLSGTAGGPTPASEYKMLPAVLETLILLTSSFSYGMASVAMQHDATRGRLLIWMARRPASSSMRTARDDLQLILFSSLIVMLMVAGTLVVLFNLRARMM